MEQDWKNTFEGVFFDLADAKHGMSWAADHEGNGYGGPYIARAREEKCKWWIEQLKTLKEHTVKWDPASKKHQTH